MLFYAFLHKINIRGDMLVLFGFKGISYVCYVMIFGWIPLCVEPLVKTTSILLFFWVVLVLADAVSCYISTFVL